MRCIVYKTKMIMNTFFEDFNNQEILKTFLILFIVIDVVGCIPLILKMKRTSGDLEPGKAMLVVSVLGFFFLFFGQSLLSLYDIELSSFRAAGGFVIFLLGAELLFDMEISKVSTDTSISPSVSPLGFPIIAGTGTLTSLVILQEDYKLINVIIAFMLNLSIVYIVLKYVNSIERALGPLFIGLLSKFFGLMLLAMGIQLIKHGFGL